MTHPLDRSQIWVVDDSRLDAERACKVLSSAHDVQLFGDGSSVIERLADPRSLLPAPDLLLLDWVMPGVSGLDVCRFVHADDGAPGRAPGVILMTARHSPEQVAEALAAGADDYVAKPWSEAELIARVDTVLRQRGVLDRAESAEGALRRILGSTPDPLLVVDADGRVAFASAEAGRAFAEDADELIGRALRDLAPGLGDASGAAIGAAHALGDVAVGARIFSPLVRRQADHVILSLRDVTALRTADVRRLDLYSIIAHDLRTPLSSMLLRTEALMRGTRGPLPPTAVNDLERMQGNIRSLVELINDFLDLARLEGTGFALHQERVDLHAVARGTVEDFLPLLRASELAWKDERAREPATVIGDPRRLVQVVSNLVANAIKFTPPGGVITTRVLVDEDAVEVHVQDTGRGIAEDAIPSLFQRYARTIDSEHQVAGTGLGLLIVREIIEAHGGEVGVQSTPGVGSRFWFRVPRAAALDDPRRDAARDAARSPEGAR